MEDSMKSSLGIALAASALFAPAAQAQSFGLYVGNGPSWGWQAPAYRPAYRPPFDWRAQQVCSGNRARQLEARLDHEYREREIDPYQGDRIHAAIDRLERRQAHECREGDLRSIYKIAGEYDRIQGRIERSAHGW
jgi:hypothetical protein